MNDFVWQRCLDVPELDATGYHDNTRSDLVEALEDEPRTVLDIGCGTGSTGAYLKKKFPEAKVWGIELNKAAAEIASGRLDIVISAKFEDADLEAAGIAKGSLDLVLCADVLEHLYNPWRILADLQEYLSERGRIVISIPNIRYLPLLDDLARGYWRYADMGILDITHLRFFTLQDLKRMIFETGYEVHKIAYGLDPQLKPQLERHRAKLPCTIDTGKIVIRDVGEQELIELYSGQFFVTIKRGTPSLLGYERPKMGCYFWSGQQTEYQKLLETHRLTLHEAHAFEKRLATLEPLSFDALVVTNRRTIDQLSLTIDSLARQLYDHCNIKIIGEGEAPAALAGSSKISWVDCGGNAWPALRGQAEASTADWLIVLEAGDQLVEHALLYAAEHAVRSPDTVAIYVDEDQFDAAMQPDNPYFKPDFAPDYFLSQAYVGDGIFFRTASLRDIGGVRTQFGSPFYDLELRLLGQFGPGAIAHLSDVLFRRHPQRSLSRRLGDTDNGDSALREHLRNTGVNAAILPGLLPGSHRIRALPSQTPKLLLISQAPDELEQARNLVEEVFLQRTYDQAELAIFAAPGLPPDVIAYLTGVDESDIKGLRVFLTDNESKASRIEAAIAASDADYVFLLRADARPANADWLGELIAEAMQPGVGAVAPRLVSPSGTVIGNAMILGCGGIATGFGHGDPYTAPGHFGRQLTPQNPSGLSSDALLFSRAIYEEVGGFDGRLEDTAAAIDFGLKIIRTSRRLLWTPYTTLICSNDQLSKLVAEDETVLLKTWLPVIARDPAYNANLSRKKPFALIEKPQISKLRLPWKPLPRLMAFPADTMGCGHYRVIEPFNAAIKHGQIDGFLGFDHYDQYDMSVFDADTLLLQRQITDEQLEFLRNYRRFFDLKLVFELDDLITNLPVESFHKSHIPKDIAKRLRAGLQLCDRFIVSTQPLAEAYRQHIDDIRVVPNRIDVEKWGHLLPRRRTSDKPRVGWAGGLSHAGDLAVIADVVKELASEVEWVFLGMCPDHIRPYVAEFHFGVPTPDYPAKLASLNLDLAIAPIAQNDFNECKSNLKLLEYGVLGYPVIASDFGPYRCDFPVELVKNRPRDWVKAIREHIADLDECARRGDALRAHVKSGWLLQDHLEEWRNAWFDF